jgi:hypothetical protein
LDGNSSVSVALAINHFLSGTASQKLLDAVLGEYVELTEGYSREAKIERIGPPFRGCWMHKIQPGIGAGLA